ncbi:MAG TPA: transporter [Thermodesulfovibrionales bacterium]|nr:transporter [Thermodesulfovibrionales bacterium]
MMQRLCGKKLTNRALPGALCSVFLCSFLWWAQDSFAAIPLITDDTGTQGKGKFQLEFFGEYASDRDEAFTNKNSTFSATLTYGILNPVDLILTVPYESWRAEGPASMEKADGLGDVLIETKWRFYEKNGFSFALKPGFTIPTGSDEKGLGTGRMTYRLFVIASKKMNPWAFHLNLAYIRNENKEDDRKDIWRASFAATVDVMKDLKLVADVGVETNNESFSKTPPAYVLGGIIWSLRENLDLGLGIRGGLTKAEPDVAVRGGITWRF